MSRALVSYLRSAREHAEPSRGGCQAWRARCSPPSRAASLASATLLLLSAAPLRPPAAAAGHLRPPQAPRSTVHLALLPTLGD